jgi:hypothetical protein
MKLFRNFFKFTKKLMCPHEWDITRGIGRYAKGKREKILMPIIRKKCKLCKKEVYECDTNYEL